ncbi:TonB-dependent outer membrane receptor, SusC/RagA subfamily, signature region [Algoriphagus hitonicola]|uniref:TonB-dependent outer membrane receptor, SusC/RagA subfamily, signature region n=1 Tax=Algoriphagus hitonicola TaxID=435880 RepID=A0A1I2UAZ6_9BACT|nr:hypothetical protein [Algoriphagus hitonicola]SFG72867.1 TonB-dependent outer membrane receptor, SusC/RagA subfamily, signature region [Algoriphagus hitonicola]
MKKLLFGLFAYFAFFPAVFAQEELPTQIQTYFENYQKETPPEKAYLHFDKHTYTLGEDVWFSAYVVAGSVQIPSPLSQTLYVDLFDGDGLLLEQKIVRIENGRGKGDFQLPAFGKPGTYRIKAYTSWMRNFGEDYFFNQKLNVIDGQGGSFLPQLKFIEISSTEGKVTYRAELQAIDESGNPLSSKKIGLKAFGGNEEILNQELVLNQDGQVSFSFSIPEKAYPSQHVVLGFFENENYEVTQKIRLPYSLSLADIQFMPESGNWLIGKNSTIAFRGVEPDGTPLTFTGQIEGVENSTFESNFAGLGKITLMPNQADYEAQIQNELGQSITLPLPKALSKGLTMQVVNNPETSYLTAFVQGTEENQDLLLVSQTRGIINYMIQGGLTNGVWGVRIPKENLLMGINQITVLDGKGIPLLERLVYINQEPELSLELSKSGTLGSRDLIKLSIQSQVDGQPAAGSYSLSVVDADQQKDESEASGTIFSSLLLDSDLKGNVHSPGYYFQNQSEETQEALDLVMLTHGWTRFQWDQVTSNQLPKIDYFIERGINIEGQITDAEDTRKGLSGGKVSAVVGEGIEIISSEYGPNGRFILRDLEYQDSVNVTITAEDNRLKNFVDVEVIQPEPVFKGTEGSYQSEIVWPEALAATYQERTLMQRMNEDPDILDLDEVTVEGQTIEAEEEEIRKIYGAGDVTLDPEKIPGSVGFTNVFQLIQGRVSGVSVYIAGTDVSVNIRGIGSLGGSGTQPLFLLDNTPVDANTLLQVSPRDVANVDVFKDPARSAIFGAQGANGVIAVYTKSGAGVSPSVGGTLVSNYGGYSIPKEFYTPKYDEKTPENAIDDKRATIYWNPLLEIGENGEIDLEYYNSDVAKRQLLIIEGMDAEGRLGRLVRVLE